MRLLPGQTGLEWSLNRGKRKCVHSIRKCAILNKRSGRKPCTEHLFMGFHAALDDAQLCSFHNTQYRKRERESKTAREGERGGEP